MRLNSKSVFIAIISALSIYNLNNIKPAAASTFTFNRTYTDFGTYEINGKFVGEDINNNQIISAEEVSEFSLSFQETDSAFGSEIRDQITAEELKEIRQFEYQIGTGSLSFFVSTTGRNAQDPEDCAIFGCESSALIDFSRQEDSYFITDMGFILADPDFTGAVTQTTPTTPEPNNMAAVALFSLAAWYKYTRRQQSCC